MITKRLMIYLSVAAFIGGCTKYGPDQQQDGTGASSNIASVELPAALSENVFIPYEMPPGSSYSLRCDLNSVGGVGLVPQMEGPLPKAEGVVFNGWVADKNGRPPAEVMIILKGEDSFAIKAQTGFDRPDVAEALKSRDAFKSGIATLANTTMVSSGSYHVYFVIPETLEACDTTKLLVASE